MQLRSSTASFSLVFSLIKWCAGLTNLILFLHYSSESVGFVLSSILCTALHRQVFLEINLLALTMLVIS